MPISRPDPAFVWPLTRGSGDPIHVAVAAVHGIQYMVSWNVKHLANVNKREHLARICARCGYIAPEILTPDVFWGTES